MEQVMTETSNSKPLDIQREKERPRFERVDGQFCMEEEKLRRFNITIQSVHYYLHEDGVRCAVLLTTAFDLADQEKLATAIVPLTARPRFVRSKSDQKQAEEKVEIRDHIPRAAEHVLISQESELKEVKMLPSLTATVVSGVAVGLNGPGMNKQRVVQHNFMIALIPQLSTPGGAPDCVQWKFANSQGIFYPESTNLMVIVERTDGPHNNWFPFELRLEWRLRVDVHHPISTVRQSESPKFFKRYVGKADQGAEPHDGWCFQIKGNYNATLAEAALRDALDKDGNITKVPPNVGLEAAIPKWMIMKVPSSTTAASQSPSNARQVTSIDMEE